MLIALKSTATVFLHSANVTVAHWINTGFKISQEAFIKEVIQLSRTHIASVKFVGKV